MRTYKIAVYDDDENPGASDIYDAMQRAPSLIYVETSLGLTARDIKDAYRALKTNHADHDTLFRLDPLTEDEIKRHGGPLKVCRHGRVLRRADRS